MVSEAKETDMPNSDPPPSRVGKVSFAFWCDPELRRKVKALAVNEGTNVEALMTEAAIDLLAKYRKKKRGTDV